jgi:hypothetical protein
MDERNNVGFKIGELTGIVASLKQSVNDLGHITVRLEERLRVSEKAVTTLMVKVGILATIAGGVGSFGIQFLFKNL